MLALRKMKRKTQTKKKIKRNERGNIKHEQRCSKQNIEQNLSHFSLKKRV